MKETTVTDICLAMNEIAPVQYAESWDNPGLLLGDTQGQVKKIMIALDLMPEVAKQAIDQKVDMIITHHPYYFNLPKTLVITDIKMYFMYELIKNNVAVYAAHTNLDAAKGGVNDVLAAKLGLDKVETIPRPECPEQGLARIGFLTKPIALKSFATKVKKALEADGVAYTDGGQDCYKVAVVGGGGVDFMEAAIEAGADTLVTGDVKYHVAQKALNLGLNIIDGGHQFTERPVLDQLEAVIKGWAEDSDRDIEIVRAEEEVILQHL